MQTSKMPVQEIPAPTLYDPAEAAQIVRHLSCRVYDPEYILLFGSLVGGIPHSDVTAYDLLVVVRRSPVFDWREVRNYLRLKMPVGQRRIPTINIYVATLDEVQPLRTPFLYLAHKQGEVLYCKDHYHFRRPARRFDFTKAVCEARRHFDTFAELGDEFLERAHAGYAEYNRVRMPALHTAQAAVYFYHTLYYVFHHEEFTCHDPVVMHERMRTLSTQLALALDDEHTERLFTLPKLGDFLRKAPYELDFDTPPEELEQHMERVVRISNAIRAVCEIRIEHYEEFAQ